MKLSLLSLFVLLLAFVSGGLLTSKDIQSGSRDLTKISSRAGIFPNKHRTLFARRGQYEQQKLQMMRPKGMPSLPKNSSTKAPKPASATCSQLGQSCLPNQGCCEPCSSCHCHFFKAICFCRRINVKCTKNT
ncbi:agouti-related protein-like [Syngnathoides biaculeatus]|uniref:agouti-related protein-like n=1 Tax=Syngnathoides biaculeatus TaxID=300417 RepID=UPI002ADD6664|nr:agouti-related protein-like [Syngnathoides biaculeatus]